METKQDYLVTYKFYDARSRRLSIFGKQEGDNLHIYVITCSNKDNFKKDRSRKIFEGRQSKDHKTRGEAYIVPINNDKPKFTFIKWCKDKYYKPRLAKFTYIGNVLAKHDDELPSVIGGLRLENVEIQEFKKK